MVQQFLDDYRPSLLRLSHAIYGGQKHVLRQRFSYRCCSVLILGAIILEGSTVRLLSYCSSVEGLVPVF